MRRDEAARPPFRITLRLFLLGLVTLLGQVVLLRELLVESFGSELVVLLSLGLLLLGTSAGAAAGRCLGPPEEAQAGRLFLLFALLLPALAAAARLLRLLFGGAPGTFLPLHEQLMGMALVLLPLGAAGGLLFQRAAALAVAAGGSLARAYAVESLGGLAGGALATALAALHAPAAALALLGGLLASAAAWPAEGRRRPVAALCAAALAGLFLAGLFWAGALDLALARLQEPDLALQIESPYGRIAVVRRLEQTSVFLSGALAGESQSTSAEAFVHPAALFVEAPRRVLLLGGGVEGLAQEALRHGPERVEQVEMDPVLLDLARSLDPPQAREAEAEGRLVRRAADPRQYLKRSGSYDLILAAMPEPESGQANRFYTREFFALASLHLRPGGVFAFRLRSAENLWTPALARRNASVAAALGEAFSHTLLLPGTATLALASGRPLALSPDLLAQRLEARQIRARLVTPPYLAYLLTNDRVEEIRRTLASARAPANTDGRPVCYPFTLVLWLSRFLPGLGFAAPVSPVARGLAGAAAAALLLLALLALRRRRRPAALALAAAAGFAGMVLEGAVLLRFQSGSGALYGDLGLLLALFMGGLAAGAWAAGRKEGERPRRFGRWLVLGLALLCLVTALACASPFALKLAGAGALLAAAGGLTGALFAHAGRLWGEDAGRAVAFLYAADLAGGCAGSLAASLFLLPFLGLAATSLLLGALAAVLAMGLPLSPPPQG